MDNPQYNNFNQNLDVFRASNYSTSSINLKKPILKIFKKVASKKSLKKLIKNQQQNIFDFYSFDNTSIFKKYTNFTDDEKMEKIDETLLQFYSGLLLLILKKVESQSKKDENFQFFLKKMILKTKDKFAISLLSKGLYDDLGEYISEYVFKSESYKKEIITKIKKIIEKKYELVKVEENLHSEKNNFFNKKSGNFNKIEEILLKLLQNSSAEYMLTFAFVQILEEFGINMSICSTDLTKNRSVKQVLYDSFALTQRDVDFVLIMLKLNKGINFSFGLKIPEFEEESINYDKYLGFNEVNIGDEIRGSGKMGALSFGRKVENEVFLGNKDVREERQEENNWNKDKIGDFLKENQNNKSFRSGGNVTLLNYENAEGFLKSIPVEDSLISDFSLSSKNKEKSFENIPVLEQESRASRYNQYGEEEFQEKQLKNELFENSLKKMTKKEAPEILNIEQDPPESYKFSDIQHLKNQRISSELNSQKSANNNFEEEILNNENFEEKKIGNYDLKKELEKKQEYADKMIKETSEAINRILGRIKEKKERSKKSDIMEKREDRPSFPLKRDDYDLENGGSVFNSNRKQKKNKDNLNQEVPFNGENRNLNNTNFFNKNFNEVKSNPTTDRNLFKILKFMDINSIMMTSKELPKIAKTTVRKKDDSYFLSPTSSKYKLLICSPERESPDKSIGKWEMLKKDRNTPNRETTTQRERLARVLVGK